MILVWVEAHMNYGVNHMVISLLPITVLGQSQETSERDGWQSLA